VGCDGMLADTTVHPSCACAPRATVAVCEAPAGLLTEEERVPRAACAVVGFGEPHVLLARASGHDSKLELDVCAMSRVAVARRTERWPEPQLLPATGSPAIGCYRDSTALPENSCK
jgi:hypothetical protein